MPLYKLYSRIIEKYTLPPLYGNVRFYITISGFIINMLCLYICNGNVVY